MSTCRVILTTYRRPDRLSRAVDSLLRQTFKDWVCEVHNDDPQDASVGDLLRRIGDPRLILKNHEANLGGTRSFNFLCGAHEEPYVSLLEDDNWWEPEFLETMVSCLESHADTSLAFSNIWVWYEGDAGQFVSKRMMRQHTEGTRLVDWPDPAELQSKVFWHGAMLARTRMMRRCRIPDETPMVSVEPVRARAFDYPLMLVMRPLANVTMGAHTYRPAKGNAALETHALLIASFLKHVRLRPAQLRSMLESFRGRTTRSHIALLAGLSDRGCRYILREFQPGDWLWALKGMMRHPIKFMHAMRAREHLSELWSFLDRSTAERASVARKKGIIGTDGSIA